jgi:tetratricopeptide (TPR) repeat protein
MSCSHSQQTLATTVSERSKWHHALCSRKRLLLAILVICAVLPYANTLANGFVYDDNSQLLSNPYVQSFHYLRQIFTTGVWSFRGPAGSNYYRPMMSLGYLFCYELFGKNAFGFHLFNVILQILIVCLVFLATERLFRDRTVAFWAAVIFALHPIHTESVAWIGGVTDLELTFFFLLTFFFFLRTARPGGGNSTRMQLAMVASFSLATISKEPALTLPFLATIYEHFFRDDRSETTWRQKLSRYDLLWAVAGIYLLVRIYLLGAFAPARPVMAVSRSEVLFSAVALAGQYLTKLLYPVQLCAFYVFHKSVSVVDWRVLAGGAALVAYAGVFAALWRRASTAAFGLVWLLATLLPVLNPNWVGENVFAERYLYLPSVGFCWVVACSGVYLWRQLRSRPAAYRRVFAACLGMLALLCSDRIVTRNRVWQDDLTLYTETLSVSPEAYVLRSNLGAVYDGLGDTADAEREWLEVLRTHPRYAITLTNMGMLYSRQGLYQLAAGYLARAIKVDPSLAGAHIMLGFMYRDGGELDKAEAQFQVAEKLAPFDIRSYVGLADIYSRKGDRGGAERILLQAKAVNPSDSGVHTSLGSLYANENKLADARREYETALRLDPTNADASLRLQKLISTTPH